ncbi:MAG: amidophosphoribosyltransferase [Bradymonadia bacterium]|jgi:amidophosphoribosyltransferase
MLQHRGQDAAGVVTCHGNRLHLKKGNGFVRDVLRESDAATLTGDMGIGHVRYPTAGSASSAEAQPFYVNSPFGIALAHNGNLTNADELKRQLFESDRRHINTSSDTEVLLNVLAHELHHSASYRLSPDRLFDAIETVHQRCNGAYAVVGMIVGHGMFAFRDPHGIRPLVFGKRETKDGTEYMVASESVALDVVGFERIRDVGPGEAIFVDNDRKLHTRDCARGATLRPCIFEHVYLARPDSLIDNISVYKSRLRMGEKLAAKINRVMPDHDIDVVIPIPDTSRTAALQLAAGIDSVMREGFIKNRYVGRTFIMPGQAQRQRSIRRKLNAIPLEFRNKNVLLVDDSIVRGNTAKQIVQMARDAGAKKVYFASAAPPVRFPNVYGIDMPAADELVAHNRSVEEICEVIGADWLIYQDIADLIASTHEGNKKITEFEVSVFTGEYITGDVDANYLAALNGERSDDAKSARDQETNEPLAAL